MSRLRNIKTDGGQKQKSCTFATILNVRTATAISALFLLVVFAVSNSHHAYADSYEVVIKKGAANPSFDPQVERPEEWYTPTRLTIKVNDTVTWINEDLEKHTVTSGMSSGRTGFVRGDLGTPDGIFDSGLFQEGEKWSYTFTFPGTFSYFCTLHPWMFGVVEVEGEIPAYPQNGEGVMIELPAMSLTPKPNYHVGTAWSPKVLKTGEQVTFINDFFDRSGTKKEHLLRYDFVIIQNGQEIHRSFGFSEYGADIRNFVFTQPGPAIIRFENVGGEKGNDAEFTTIVYQGSGEMSADAIISKNKQDPTLIIAGLYAAIFGPLVGGVAVWMHYWKPWRKKRDGSI
jgi:plastocyanin